MTILLEEGLEFSKDRLAETVSSDFSNATDVADYLVSKGIPFREAYQLVGRIVKNSLEAGFLLREINHQHKHLNLYINELDTKACKY